MEGSILSVHFEFGAGQDKCFPESSPNSPPLLKKKNKIKTKNKNKQTQTPLGGFAEPTAGKLQMKIKIKIMNALWTLPL